MGQSKEAPPHGEGAGSDPLNGLEQAAAEGLERTTLRGYRRVAENQIRPALGCRRLSKACGMSLGADSFVFTSSPDGSVQWWPSNLDARFRRLRRRLGLPEWVKLHGLRHTQVTQLLDAGVPLRTVSGRVGHRNPSTTTNIYRHWLPRPTSAPPPSWRNASGGKRPK